MSICARCDEPIGPGEAAESFVHDSASAGGDSVTVHQELCARPERQTAPESFRFMSPHSRQSRRPNR
ncbi:hypothetical protein ACFWFF_01660 [Streptomyces sp. NPDC060223]|uniref:hypothetical protein n=1 Tax=unclassified Streptomyces TaxID=2593676 RepID=UPI0036331D58